MTSRLVRGDVGTEPMVVAQSGRGGEWINACRWKIGRCFAWDGDATQPAAILLSCVYSRDLTREAALL